MKNAPYVIITMKKKPADILTKWTKATFTRTQVWVWVRVLVSDIYKLHSCQMSS